MSLDQEILTYGSNFNVFKYKEFYSVTKIDEGEFGTIYKAFWKDCGITVVFKKLKNNKACQITQK
ncbi:13319_t:CDS:1, partial [Dentiscutata erythropus]